MFAANGLHSFNVVVEAHGVQQQTFFATEYTFAKTILAILSEGIGRTKKCQNLECFVVLRLRSSF